MVFKSSGNTKEYSVVSGQIWKRADQQYQGVVVKCNVLPLDDPPIGSRVAAITYRKAVFKVERQVFKFDGKGSVMANEPAWELTINRVARAIHDAT